MKIILEANTKDLPMKNILGGKYKGVTYKKIYFEANTKELFMKISLQANTKDLPIRIFSEANTKDLPIKYFGGKYKGFAYGIFWRQIQRICL